MYSLFEVYQGKQKVGTVQVKKQGLYYIFSGVCDLREGEIWKLLVTCNGKTESIGILTPRQGGFGIETRLPIKRLGDGNMLFSVVPKNAEQEVSFIPVKEDQPFGSLDKLEKARFVIRNGIVGMMIENQKSMESSSPTGQWSEPRISE